MRPCLAAKIKQVAEPVISDKASLCAAPLYQRVCCHGCAVPEKNDLCFISAETRDRFVSAFGDSFGGVVRCTRKFPYGKMAAGFVKQANVGEGASRIDTNAKRGHGKEPYWFYC